MDVALRWGIGYDSTVRSFVNIISTPKGGTHQSGFEQALLKTFRKAVETNARKLKAGNDKIEKDDIFAGLTAVLTVRLAEPQFEGQTKEILGTSAVRAIVAKVVEQEINAKLNSANRNDKAQSALLLEKIVSEMKSRISARVHKETQRRKNALETSSHAHQARRLPHGRRRRAPSCSSSRATPRWARPSWRAPPTSRRCCRSAARSSTSRRPRWGTCSPTPNARRSSRWSAPVPAAASTSAPPATARSSS